VAKLKTPINEPQRLAALKAVKLLDTPPEPVFDALTSLAKQVWDTPIALITLLDESRQWFKSNFGLSVNQTPRDIAFCNHTIQSEDIFVVHDALNHHAFQDNPLVTGEPNIRFYAGVPLIDKNGYALGALCVIDHKPRGAVDEAQKSHLIAIASLVVEQINTRMTQGALDPITALPNRLRLQHDIKNNLTNKPLQRVSLIVADAVRYDQYASLIQSLGHGNGDKFLRSASDKLRKTESKNVTLYNLAVFRFAWLVVDHTEQELDNLVQKINHCSSQSFQCGPLSILADGAIGVARYPEDASDGEELIRASVCALLDAKKVTTRVAYYDSASDKKQCRSFKILSDLPLALQSDGQFHLVYQPKIDLQNNRCVGVEALIRWHHPQLGFIPPDEFIVLAENTTLMNQITEWVINQVFKLMANWHHDLTVAINISIIDLETPHFVDKLKGYLNSYQIDPSKVELEITETTFMENPEQAIVTIDAIKALGVAVSIDDFGTGQSNFSYLKHIHSGNLKIDKLFFENIPHDNKDVMLVSAIINLAQSMEFGVVAEGIETQVALDWVAQSGCHLAQGYYIAKPLTIEQLGCWLDENKAVT
jgi:EAL domain-containing protein (putative c-di-GMP-specific phosphodiesterase class I)/GGDEF domain-containing protein